MDKAIESFARQAESWKRFFRARARIALAIREDDGWHLWYSYTAYLPDAPEKYEKVDVHTPTVRAFRQLTPIEDTDSSERAIAELLENTPA